MAIIQLSSFSALRWYATAGLYGGTKTFNKVFGELVQRQCASNIRNKVDNMVLMPGLVSTAMTAYVQNGYNTCLPDETAEGTLKDVGFRIGTHGSLIHTLWGLQIALTPEWIRNE